MTTAGLSLMRTVALSTEKAMKPRFEDHELLEVVIVKGRMQTRPECQRALFPAHSPVIYERRPHANREERSSW